MKKIAFLASSLFLVACSNAPATNLTEFNVYMDLSSVKTDVFEISTKDVRFSPASGNQSLSVSLRIKNTTSKTQPISFSEKKVTRESTGIDYQASIFLPAESIEPDLVEEFSFTATVPASDAEEKFSFSVTFSSVRYTVKLYETPDELRANKTVTYVIDGKEVYTQTVKQGSPILGVYVYESTDHLWYCNDWETNGMKLSPATQINDDITVTGQVAPTLSFYDIYTSKTTPISLEKVYYVCRDGVVVVPETYTNKTVTQISNLVIYRLPKLKTLYLPKTIERIMSYNFVDCGSLRTINFAGTKQQWDAIQTSSPVPSTIEVKFGVEYKN